jgi:hypothetical protein
MKKASTLEITEELITREGIEKIKIKPHEEFKIIAGHEEKVYTGPAIIIINQD